MREQEVLCGFGFVRTKLKKSMYIYHIFGVKNLLNVLESYPVIPLQKALSQLAVLLATWNLKLCKSEDVITLLVSGMLSSCHH